MNLYVYVYMYMYVCTMYVCTPNGTSIGSSALAQLMVVINRPRYVRNNRPHPALRCGLVTITGWRRGAVVSGVRRMNEVNARPARLVLGWVTVFRRVYHLGMQ